MRELLSSRPLSDPEWAALLARCRDATPFHDPLWATLLSETYRYRGFVLGIADAADRLTAGAPFLAVRTLAGRRRWISLPFTDECPLLAADAAAHERLIAALTRGRAGLGAPGLEVRAPVAGAGWSMGAVAVTHELALASDPDRIRGAFSKSQVIRNISRAEREGVTVRAATGRDDLAAFYALHTRTRRRQGVPVQPRRFFTLLWERLVAPGRARILLADAGEQRAIAGALFLTGYGTTIYKFGASDVTTRHLRPNHLIFWTAIREACRRGDRRFDFGRSDLENTGLRAFKAGWGAIERPLVYSALAPSRREAQPGLSSRALSVAIRRGPGWMCRATGETLYRYAGSR